MMITFIRWSVLFVIALIAQSTVVPSISIFGARPDLLLLVLFFVSLRYGVMTGIWVGFSVGLLRDLYTPAILGQHALAGTVAGFFIGLFNERIMRTGPFLKLLVLLLGFAIHDLVYTFGLVLAAGASPALLGVNLFTVAIPRAVYTGILAAAWYVWETFGTSSTPRR